MISAIVSAAAGAIELVVDLLREGKTDEAQMVVDRFVATTQTQLDTDRGTAEDILARRFPDSQPPEEE